MTTRLLPGDPPWLKAAFGDLGLREIAGPKNHPRIIAMYAKAGHGKISEDEVPWCAAAVGAWLKEGGQPNSGSLMARSYAKYGRKLDKSKTLPRGAIAVWPRGKPPSGHVNLVLADDGTYLTCIGGNQSPAPGSVSISRERKGRLIAATWPSKYPLPTDKIPLPQPRPKIETDSEDEDHGEPVPLPTPKPEPPQQPDPVEPEKPGRLRRFRNWLIGITSSFSGFSFLAYLTDWQVAAVFSAFVVIILLLAVVFFLWLFGKQRVAAWFSKELG